MVRQFANAKFRICPFAIENEKGLKLVICIGKIVEGPTKKLKRRGLGHLGESARDVKNTQVNDAFQLRSLYRKPTASGRTKGNKR
jgi:hypothetical protein